VTLAPPLSRKIRADGKSILLVLESCKFEYASADRAAKAVDGENFMSLSPILMRSTNGSRTAGLGSFCKPEWGLFFNGVALDFQTGDSTGERNQLRVDDVILMFCLLRCVLWTAPLAPGQRKIMMCNGPLVVCFFRSR